MHQECEIIGVHNEGCLDWIISVYLLPYALV